MNLVLMALTCMALINISPALAAPRQIEDFCFAQLEQVRPPLSSGRGDREAFMANCIADLTPGPPEKLRRYKRPR
jgi:hypothetical protein